VGKVIFPVAISIFRAEDFKKQEKYSCEVKGCTF